MDRLPASGHSLCFRWTTVDDANSLDMNINDVNMEEK